MKVTNAYHNKSKYFPGDIATLTINADTDGPIAINIYHLNDKVATLSENVNNGQLTLSWPTPNTDYQGYRAEIVADNVVQSIVAIDVSSNSDKFPRYGSLTSFGPGNDNTNKINVMKDLNINLLEYYDVYYKPQEPFPVGDEKSNYKKDWAKFLPDNGARDVSGQVVSDSIESAKNVGIDNMLYDMIYAITGNAQDNNYLKSIGVDPSWILYNEDGQPFNDNIVDQTYLDITNPDMINWLTNRVLNALNAMNFDGWHGDTIGDNSPKHVHDSNGNTTKIYDVDDWYAPFANRVKKILGNKKFTINSVNGQGEKRLSSSNIDFPYSETWFGSYYYVDQRIKAVNNVSGKSMVIPGYLQEGYTKKHSGGQFNPNAVLLFDAICYAAGGSRLEIVDGDRLLVTEYFPNTDLSVSDDLKSSIRDYYTFITAYENLLRDGQKDNNNLIKFYTSDNDSIDVSDIASPHTIYGYGRSSNTSETIQLINMLGVTSDQWQDDDGSRQEPIPLNNFTIKYYTDRHFEYAYLATPDGSLKNQSISLNITNGNDNNGNYIAVTVPYIKRWDMIYFR